MTAATSAIEYKASWLVHDLLADEIEDYGQDQLIEALSGGSRRRTAVLTCVDAAWTIVDEGLIADVSGGDTTTRLLDGLGFYSDATECASAWQQADAEALGRYSTTATWGDDIADLGTNPAVLQRGDDLLGRVARGLGAVARAAR